MKISKKFNNLKLKYKNINMKYNYKNKTCKILEKY